MGQSWMLRGLVALGDAVCVPDGDNDADPSTYCRDRPLVFIMSCKIPQPSRYLFDLHRSSLGAQQKDPMILFTDRKMRRTGCSRSLVGRAERIPDRLVRTDAMGNRKIKTEEDVPSNVFSKSLTNIVSAVPERAPSSCGWFCAAGSSGTRPDENEESFSS